MKKQFRFPLQLVLFAALALIFVGCRDYTPQEKYEKGVDYLSWKLDLTEEQQTYLKNQKEDLLKIVEEGKKNKESIGKTILDQLSKDRMDEEVLMELVDTQQKRFDQYATLLIPKLTEFHAMLTSEQKDTLLEEIKELKEKHEDD